MGEGFFFFVSGSKAPANEETLFPEIFLGCSKEQEAKKLFCFLAAQTRKHLPRKQNVSENIQKHFCFRDQCCVSAQTGKHFEKHCFRYNVSTTMFPRLRRP